MSQGKDGGVFSLKSRSGFLRLKSRIAPPEYIVSQLLTFTYNKVEVSEMIKSEITHIGVTDSLALITVDGISSDINVISSVFESVADRGIDVDMISMSLRHKNKMDLSFTVPADNLGEAVASIGELRRENARLLCHISGSNSKITLSGVAPADEIGITSEISAVLAKNNIPVKLICASVNEISILVDEVYADTAFKFFAEKYITEKEE